MENRNEQPSQTVRIYMEPSRKDEKAARAIIEGLAAAGFEVEIKPFIECGVDDEN